MNGDDVLNNNLAALGKLSAGLAHELNNPASAAQRSAQTLSKQADLAENLAFQLGRECSDDTQLNHIFSLKHKAIDNSKSRKEPDPLTRSDLEDKLCRFLDEYEIPEAYEISVTLVSYHVEETDLNKLITTLPSRMISTAVQWLAASLSVRSITHEVDISMERISQLVGAIKSYSQSNQAGKQATNIHEGLDNTLIMLNHKLYPKITVVKNFDDNLPNIQAYAGELNQVWTNIIDNAIDSMNGEGKLTITTNRSNTKAVINITDTGPGIPADFKKRIFEPFVTTKGDKGGNGLGLDISKRIIQNHHNGSIALKSEKGSTRFTITLPLSAD